AVERGDDGSAALPDREDEVAGQAGELEQSGGVAGEKRPDDVLDVAPAAEGPASAGDDDGTDARLGIERAEGIAQLGVDLEGERVEPVRAIQGDRRDRGRGIERVVERAGREGHRSRIAVASI